MGPLRGWRIDALGAYFAHVHIPDGTRDAFMVGEVLATECGLLSLVGPFFGPGHERHSRLAFAKVGLEVGAQVPAWLRPAGIRRPDAAAVRHDCRNGCSPAKI